jgi:acyl dehydratase
VASAAPPPLYVDDLHEGQVIQLGSRRIEQDEMIEFARQWDPQPIHVDPEAAAQSHFGGLIASGWQSLLLTTRVIVDELIGTSGLGSPGMRDVRFLKPVRPGDELRLRLTVVEARPSQRVEGRGTARFLAEVENQDGELVASYEFAILLRRRPE